MNHHNTSSSHVVWFSIDISVSIINMFISVLFNHVIMMISIITITIARLSRPDCPPIRLAASVQRLPRSPEWSWLPCMPGPSRRVDHGFG